MRVTCRDVRLGRGRGKGAASKLWPWQAEGCSCSGHCLLLRPPRELPQGGTRHAVLPASPFPPLPPSLAQVRSLVPNAQVGMVAVDFMQELLPVWGTAPFLAPTSPTVAVDGLLMIHKT